MKIDLDKLYENYADGRINAKELANEIITCIFSEPHRFGIAKMDSDLKSEFIVFLLQKIEKYIVKYEKKLSVFSTYIISIIYNLRKSWVREFYHKCAHKQSVYYYIESEEPTYVIAEQDYMYNDNNEVLTKEELSERDKLTILVLALKSFFYLKDCHIKHISHTTGISIDSIQELIHKLTIICEDKCNRNSKKQEKINSSFIKKNRFSLELMNINTNSPLAYHLKKAQLFHTEQWKKNLKRYNEGSPLKPSNANIAETLQIKECKVYQLLHESRARQKKGIPIIGKR